MRREPVVSVLLPVRDEAPYLKEALESLSGQTFADFEVVVVDDGSVDGSAEIAAAHAAGDSRFRLLRAPRSGLVDALERARSQARGRLLARMDGDDVSLPDRLATQLDVLEEDRLDACGTGVAYFPEAEVRDGSRRYERWLNGLVTTEAAARDVFVECPLPHPTLLVRREALEAAGGYRRCDWPEDYDLVLRLWAAGARFRNVDRVLLRWREHAGRASRRERIYGLDAFVRCKVHHLRATLLRRRSGVVVWGAGPVGKGFARELAAQGERVAAFVEVDPRKIGRAVYGIPVVAVDEAPRFGDAFAVGAVAGEQARTRIREVLVAQGRIEGRDFVAVA